MMSASGRKLPQDDSTQEWPLSVIADVQIGFQRIFGYERLLYPSKQPLR